MRIVIAFKLVLLTPQIENQPSQSYNVNDSKFMEMYEKTFGISVKKRRK